MTGPDLNDLKVEAGDDGFQPPKGQPWAEPSSAAAEVPDAGHEEQSQVDLLVALVTRDAAVELFHTPETQLSEAFVSLPMGGHVQTMPIRSRGLEYWLRKGHQEVHGKLPGQAALTSAIEALAGLARFEGPEREVHVRLAGSGDRDTIWLDLGREDWSVIRITAEGWERVEAKGVPVRFLRPRGLLPLPEPVPGGHVDELRPFVNVGKDEWTLLCGFLAMLLNPDGDYPVLNVSGEQASCKSTLCRLVRDIVDPNSISLRRPSREQRDLVIAAQNSLVVAFDNLSEIKPWLSDALCCLTTGAGFSTRALYKDAEEAIFSARRPVILNGIENLVVRGDLASRCIPLCLEPIPEEQRRLRSELEAAFAEAHPRILGGLLDAAATALRNRRSVRPERVTRLADFCLWVTAAEPALGLSSGSFMAVYRKEMLATSQDLIESCSIGPYLLLLLEQGEVAATASDLLARLNELRGQDRVPTDWPTSGQKLSSQLRRLAPALRSSGIAYARPAEGDNPRLHRISRQP